MHTRISKLDVIKGEKVVAATLEIGDAGIELKNGAQVAFYNLFEIKARQSLNAEDLVGRTLIDVKESESSVEFVFEGDLSVAVDMRAEAFTGPEAMQLMVPGEPIVIWN
jgi:hypothetical protein